MFRCRGNAASIEIRRLGNSLVNLGQPLACLANMTYHDPKGGSLLMGIFFVLFAGALVIDLLTYWPIVIASW